MFSNLVDNILNLPVDVLSYWGYAIISLLSIIESVPLIGLVIPGGVMVVGAGFFVKIGILHFWPLIIFVSISAFVGDSVAYFLGRRFGYDFLVRLGKYVFFKLVHFEKAKKVLQTHPCKAIIVGRFHSLTRCIMPFAAGFADIKPSLFLPLAALSAVIWTTSSVVIGFIFGQGFQVASKYLGVVFFVAFTLSVFVVYIYQFISRFTEKNRDVIERFQIYPLLLNIISIYVLAKIIESVRMGTRIHHFNVGVSQFFEKLQSPFLTDFFVAVTSIATPTCLTIVGCVLTAYFIYRRRWYFLILLPSSLFAGIISFSVLKKLIHVARPLFPMVATADFSFPSGHATVAVIFFGLIIYFFKDSIRSIIWRRVYVSVCVFAAAIVCVSRLYLNAHWLPDVLAGAFLGVFWITLFIILLRFFTSLSPRRIGQELEKEIKEGQGVSV